jgi:multiple antibiotic resistance protein
MTLFSIINPFGVAFVFLSMTRYASEAERAAMARRVGLFSFAVLIASLLIGSHIMRFFGISMPALRIAGGLVVALSGWSMLSAPADDAGAEATPTHPANLEDRAFFPLTVPLTTGPGTIAAAIALGAIQSPDLRDLLAGIGSSLIVAVLVALTITVAFTYAGTMSRWIGAEGTRVITRLTAFLLMCVGVQIILTGVADILPQLIAAGMRSPDLPPP